MSFINSHSNVYKNYAMVRLSTPYLNKSLEKALKHRSKILENSSISTIIATQPQNDEHPFGEDVEMIRQHKLKCKLLTLAEQDEAVAKYKCGMTMMAIADECGFHYTTVGRLLRARRVRIRSASQD